MTWVRALAQTAGSGVFASGRLPGNYESVKTADIEVRIVIDREGAVVCAGGTAAEPDLFEQSVAAAHQWKFKPYELKGKAVVVESSIIFHFSNGKVGAR